MLERRQFPRNRVYYGGMVAFNARNSTLACVVRNFSQRGAKIEFENSAMLPDRVDFEIERRGLSCLAHLVWRDHNAAGLVFSDVQKPSRRRAKSFRWTGRASCARPNGPTGSSSRASISFYPSTDLACPARAHESEGEDAHLLPSPSRRKSGGAGCVRYCWR